MCCLSKFFIKYLKRKKSCRRLLTSCIARGFEAQRLVVLDLAAVAAAVDLVAAVEVVEEVVASFDLDQVTLELT